MTTNYQSGGLQEYGSTSEEQWKEKVKELLIKKFSTGQHSKTDFLRICASLHIILNIIYYLVFISLLTLVIICVLLALFIGLIVVLEDCQSEPLYS